MPNYYRTLHSTFAFMAEASFIYFREGDGIVTFIGTEGKYRIVRRAWVDDDDWEAFHTNIGESTPLTDEHVYMIKEG